MLVRRISGRSMGTASPLLDSHPHQSHRTQLGTYLSKSPCEFVASAGMIDRYATRLRDALNGTNVPSPEFARWTHGPKPQKLSLTKRLGYLKQSLSREREWGSASRCAREISLDTDLATHVALLGQTCLYVSISPPA